MSESILPFPDTDECLAMTSTTDTVDSAPAPVNANALELDGSRGTSPHPGDEAENDGLDMLDERNDSRE